MPFPDRFQRAALPVAACLAMAACASAQPEPQTAAQPAPTTAPAAAAAPASASVPEAASVPAPARVASAPAAPESAAGAASTAATERAAFVQATATEHGVDSAQVDALLSQARYQQSIIDAITRPAEGKPWHAYRPIFMTEKRIADGRAFLAEHRDALQRVEQATGVPAALVVAIIGVETSYGRITGSYRVLDALYTLGFHFPPRQDFFRRELAQLFALAEEESLPLASLKGSYAGAMGWGQFMPSSYRAYAVDGDGDGTRDLFASLPDIFASVANYFVAHGWQPGAPVALPAVREASAEPLLPGSSETSYDLAALGELGYRPQRAVGSDLPATLLTLQAAGGEEYWITFRNFYVITRYNRSPLYAMAVYQLANAIAGDDVGAPATSADAPAAQ